MIQLFSPVTTTTPRLSITCRAPRAGARCLTVCPTAPWFLPNPLILNNGPGFGVQPGGFGFTISWATNASVVVEAATNLANPVWIPVSTNPLTGGTNYFSDPQWTNYPERFYRATSAFTVGGTLTGLPAGDTVTLQDNGWRQPDAEQQRDVHVPDGAA